jgi:hypothetical protein
VKRWVFSWPRDLVKFFKYFLILQAFLCFEPNIFLVCLLVADKVEIGQIIFIGPGLYFFSPFTIPALTIPTSNTNLGHAPRLIRTLLCLRYNIIKKIEKFKELAKEGQQRFVKPRIKYATGITPGRHLHNSYQKYQEKIVK